MASASMPLPPIVDGFAYNDQLVYHPMKSFMRDLQSMDTLRRANQYRCREHCLPDNANVPILPWDTFYTQVEIAGGSYLWGYNFVSISATNANDEPAETTASDLLIQAVDSCSGIPLFQDYCNGFGVHTNGNARCFPILLPKPRIILEPGLVNVFIANRTANSIICQLRLRFAESCRVIDEKERQKFYQSVGLR